MLIPKENRRKIYEYLFQEGTLVAKKDFNAPKHADIDVLNLQVNHNQNEIPLTIYQKVIKALQSLESRQFVTSRFSWGYYYYYLNNEGIEYLREYLHLPAEIVPRTLIKSTRPMTKQPAGPPKRFEKKEQGADADYKPQFSGVGRGAPVV